MTLCQPASHLGRTQFQDTLQGPASIKVLLSRPGVARSFFSTRAVAQRRRAEMRQCLSLGRCEEPQPRDSLLAAYLFGAFEQFINPLRLHCVSHGLPCHGCHRALLHARLQGCIRDHGHTSVLSARFIVLPVPLLPCQHHPERTGLSAFEFVLLHAGFPGGRCLYGG